MSEIRRAIRRRLFVGVGPLPGPEATFAYGAARLQVRIGSPMPPGPWPRSVPGSSPLMAFDDVLLVSPGLRGLTARGPSLRYDTRINPPQQKTRVLLQNGAKEECTDAFSDAD